MMDGAPPIWLPPLGLGPGQAKPAIIRPIEHALLRPGFLPAARAERRAALKELIARKVVTPDQAQRALVGFFVPPIGFKPYQANAVNFDGTNDYLTRDAGLTGAEDSKLWTGSVWINRGVDDVAERILAAASTVAGATARNRMTIGASNNFLVIGYRVDDSTIIFNLSTSVDSVLAANGWQHIMFSFDLSDTGKRHLYLDDVSDLNVTSYTNEDTDFTHADWAVGGDADGSEKLTGDLADLLVWPGVYVDLSVEANRRLFIDAGGNPVNPAASIAALGTPLVALYGPTSTWHVNQGSGEGFTENGALTDAATSPSD